MPSNSFVKMTELPLHGGHKIAKLSRDAEIVISGMSGKFPNSNSVKEYIENLLNKIDLCDDRERYKVIVNPEIPKCLGKIPNLEKSDLGYFGFHAKHGYNMDPMCRILHEQVVAALFDAGINSEELKGTRTGVFIASCMSEYDMLMYVMDGVENKNLPISAIRSMTANKISYHLQVNGPSMNADTACSSSAYAMHEAYEAILYGRCDRAIVGSYNMCLEPASTLQFARLGVLNPGTGCRPFDEDAQGYTRGEGVVAIILQKRSEAKRAYGTIVHMSTNSDGFKMNGITFPSTEGQFALMKNTYLEAQVSQKMIGFLEAHGTGTKVGDPEELNAIVNFFSPTVAKPLLIGSVKGNIGHTEPVAALCSLVKVLYALYYEKIPPNIHYNKPRECVAALNDKRLVVVTDVTPFPPDSSYAGINSFGFGGANGHIILKKCDHENQKSLQTLSHPRLVCYSGRTQTAIETLHQEISSCSDIDSLQLMQEYFKIDSNQHLFRGFTILASNKRSSLRLDPFFQVRIALLAGTITEMKHFHDLIKIPLLNNISKEAKFATDSKELDSAVLMQIILLKTFKELGFVPHFFEQDTMLSNYFHDKITFTNLIGWCMNQKKSKSNLNANTFKSIDKWINDNSYYGTKCTIVSIGENGPYLSKALKKCNCNVIQFTKVMSNVDFLFNIGKIYEAGCTLQVQKLETSTKFPVRMGTKMLSHLMDWKHKSFSFPVWNDELMYDSEESRYVQKKYYTGHLINNRNLFPATGYLFQVWKFFAKINKNHYNRLDIVFEDVKFLRACTYSDQGITLYIVLQHDGVFEVSEKASAVVTGKIRIYHDGKEEMTRFPIEDFDNVDDENNFVLNNKDAYRELRLRGYNYKGLFRAIHKVSPHGAEIKWDNHWVTFLDNIMQVAILQMDSRELFVPVGIERLVIRPSKQLDYMNGLEDHLVPLKYCRDSKTIHSKFIELAGLQARSIAMKKSRLQPVLESYQFIPNKYSTNLATSTRINVQILLECKQTLNFRVVEMLGLNKTAVIEHICNAIQDLPLILPDLTVVTSQENVTIDNVQVITNVTDQNLLFICQDPDEDIILMADKALLSDGFLLCVCSKEHEFPDMLFTLLTKHIIDDDRIVYFLRKIIPMNKTPTIYDISDMDELKWVKDVQDAVKNQENLVLLAQNNYKNGILGFTNCLTKEPNNTTVRCVFIQDGLDKVDSNNNNLMQEQLEKQMTINVYKNGEWGTYRHLVLPNLNQISSYHRYANTMKAGELSTLKWMRGPISEKMEAKAKIAYSALNFRDLMLASGKLSIESVTMNRFYRTFILGLEYSGYSMTGKRVCGIGLGSISNWLPLSYLMMDIPDHFSFEDAATIMVVYCTVLYALRIVAHIQRGQSILIHSGTGGVGLAALNVCSYFECDIFVTVGTKEKREYLLTNYPNINPRHIGNSRDTSFKNMIFRETNGRGVDLVLNSLAEEKLQASVECLADGGYFLEIGKYDLDKNSNLFLDLTMKNASYSSVMLDKTLDESNTHLMSTMIELLQHGIKEGYVKALPRTIFHMDELEKAFRYLGAGKHIGKVLIKIDHEKEHKVQQRFYCDPTRSYIIFGGLGGFGLELADWLILRGAKHIILSSRKGITTGYQRYRIRIWKSYGVNVTILTDDVTDYDTCYKAIETINSSCPLDGIFNLAVVLKDSLWENQTMDTIKTSMAPKALLTDHLDKITRKLCHQLRYFVVFSSVSCGRGNAGQTNYGFSNSVMERICELRHTDGLPSLAIQWGAVGDVGILEELQRENNEIAIGGTLQQKVLDCLAVFDQLILQSRPIVSSIVVAEKFNKGIANTPTEAVCQILGINDMKKIPMHTLLPEFGMDSMMAVEIKQTLERDFDILLNPNDLRNLTFAKLEEISGGNHDNANVGEINNIDLLPMIIQRLNLVRTNQGIIDFNIEASKSRGDFVLIMPGIDGELDIFETISKVINRHVKCVYYDAIAINQTHVDVIVDYILSAVGDDIVYRKSFQIVAHSLGCFATIELTKRLEEMNVQGKLILIDSAPEMMFQVYSTIKKERSEEEFQCNIIENIIYVTLPNENAKDIRPIIKGGNNFVDRVELVMKHYVNVPLEVIQQVKSLLYSFTTRLNSINEYRKQDEGNKKIRSKVVLYKPNKLLSNNVDLPEDYHLSMICESVENIYTFDGTHFSILVNDELQQQLLKDIE